MNTPRNPLTDTHAASHPSRRGFLTTSAAGILSGTALLSGTGPSTPATAAEPLPRNGASHMKLSLAAYSMRKYLPRNWPSPRGDNSKAAMTISDFIDYSAALDLDGCELTSYFFPEKVDTPYLLRLKQQAFRLGLSISGTAIGNDFCYPEGEARDKQLAMTRQWIDFAATMSAPVIRIFAGRAKAGDSEEIAIERCAAGIDEALEYAAEKGVFLALENHGGITSTPEQLLRIIKAVKPSPWFGVNLDSGNFRTEDPYGDLEKIAPYAINAQIKTEMSVKGKKQEADLKRIVSILRNANYRGFVVLEYEAGEEPKEAIPRYIGQLRELITA